MIYLDYSANTPADPAVLDAFCRTEQAYIGNPNSAHPAGRAAQAEMARATEGIAALLGVSPEEIIYTSGASESNNLALKGIAQASRHVGRHILSTALEHSSVGGALSALQQQGCEVDLVDIGRDGTVDLEHLRELLRRGQRAGHGAAHPGDRGRSEGLSQLPLSCGRHAGRGQDRAGAGRRGQIGRAHV